MLKLGDKVKYKKDGRIHIGTIKTLNINERQAVVLNDVTGKFDIINTIKDIIEVVTLVSMLADMISSLFKKIKGWF